MLIENEAKLIVDTRGRFKASDKQTKRSNRLKWSAFFSYGKRSKSFNKEENSESIEDAQFKD